MKNIIRISLLLFAALFLLSLTGCVGISMENDGLVLGETYRLESGETLDHDLTVIGGNATLDENSTVNGDLAVIGGNVIIDGRVNGDVSVMGGVVDLDDNAVVTGNLNTLGGTVSRSPSARVEGRETRDNPFRITTMRTPPLQVSFDPITGPLMAIFQGLALAALAIVVNLFAPQTMERAGRAATGQPVAAGGVGLLTLIVAPALLIVMGITIILLPLSLLGFLVLGVAALFGWLSLGLMVGRQVAVWLKQPWSEPVNAGVGTLVLSLLSSMLNLIPCLGWLANALIWFIALGTVVLTRFGTQAYPAPFEMAPGPRPSGPVAPPDVTAPYTGARVYETRESGPENPDDPMK